jgi:hypothetical protein
MYHVTDVWMTMVHLMVMLFRGLRQQQHSHPQQTRQTRQVAGGENVLLVADYLSLMIPRYIRVLTIEDSGESMDLMGPSTEWRLFDMSVKNRSGVYRRRRRKVI